MKRRDFMKLSVIDASREGDTINCKIDQSYAIDSEVTFSCIIGEKE